jgi:hypothetical protein
VVQHVEKDWNSVSLLQYLGPEARLAVPNLLSVLSKEKIKELPYPPEHAITALRKIGGDAREITSVMVAVLEHGNGAREAVECLGELGPKAKSAMPALIKYMIGGDHSNQVAALSALEKMEEPKLLAPLLVPQMLAELKKNGYRPNSQEFEIACAEYFGRQRSQAKEVVPFLVARMKSWKGSYWMPPYVEALGSIGPAAKEALPALEEIAASSESLDLRTVAKEAIRKINQK